VLTRRCGAALLLALVAVVGSLLAPAPASGWTRPPDRIAGADRYQTAVDLSRAAFPGTARAVVVAHGDSFADGLAAGPLGALVDGPVLLTRRTALPASTAGELRRLQPSSVYVVGGSGAIGDAVVDEIRGATGRSPRRLAGADRFETAAAVAALFPTGASRAYVANGMNFHDSLAGGAAAAIAGAPLLLVQPDLLPPSAATAIERLRPSELVVLGGAAAVGRAVEQQLRARAAVRRLEGPDRYATAAAIAEDVGVGDDAIVVTGESYADALAAATLARRRRAPVVLTTTTCAPQPTVDLLQRRGWPDLTGAGGTGVLSSRALAIVPCTRVPDQQPHPGVGISTAILPGPSVARVITFDPRQGLTLRSTTATGRVGGRLPVTQIARRLATPLITVNGAFFAGGGEPVYPFAVDGRLIHAPGKTNDSFVGLDPARPGHLLVAKPALAMALRPDAGGEIPLHRVNSGLPASPDEVVMFTREQPGTRTPDHPSCRAQLRDAGPVGITEGNITARPVVVETVRCAAGSVTTGSELDTVLALQGTPGADRIAALEVGDRLTMRWTLHPTSGSIDVVGANTSLVFGGKVSSDVTGNTGPFWTERAPRTAIGARPDGTIVIVVVDGRQPGYSVGVTPRQLADFLISIGVEVAANLDGGGSSAVSVNGVLANRPSDPAGERSVGSALVIMPPGTSPTYAPQSYSSAGVVDPASDPASRPED
jgi:putative cell wall-binding protein